MINNLFKMMIKYSINYNQIAMFQYITAYLIVFYFM